MWLPTQRRTCEVPESVVPCPAPSAGESQSETDSEGRHQNFNCGLFASRFKKGEIILLGSRSVMLSSFRIVDPRFEELNSGTFIEFKSREQLAATMTFQFENADKPGATFLDGGEKFTDGRERAIAGLSPATVSPPQ